MPRIQEITRPDGTDVSPPFTVDPAYAFDGRDGQLDWSPDGKWLVACAGEEAASQKYLALVSRATGEVLPLPFTARDNLCGATWRPT